MRAPDGTLLAWRSGRAADAALPAGCTNSRNSVMEKLPTQPMGAATAIADPTRKRPRTRRIIKIVYADGRGGVKRRRVRPSVNPPETGGRLDMALRYNDGRASLLPRIPSHQAVDLELSVLPDRGHVRTSVGGTE